MQGCDRFPALSRLLDNGEGIKFEDSIFGRLFPETIQKAVSKFFGKDLSENTFFGISNLNLP